MILDRFGRPFVAPPAEEPEASKSPTRRALGFTGGELAADTGPGGTHACGGALTRPQHGSSWRGIAGGGWVLPPFASGRES